MSTFNAIGIAGSGVTVYRKWLDAVADNLANINTTTRTSENAFQARYVAARSAQDGNGAEVAGVRFGSAEGIRRTSRRTRSPTPRATSAARTSTWATRWPS
jgi:flagellar basal-body rod protein FlgC